MLPAALALVLALAAIVQLIFSSGSDLPTGGVGMGGASRLILPAAKPAAIPPEIMARPLFAPRVAPAEAGADQAAGNALGGSVIAGSVAIRGRSWLFVRHADGRIERLGLGAVISGWRIAAIGRSDVRLIRAGKTMNVPYGAAAPADAAPAEQGDTQ
jgi:hypothetical protein